MFNSCKYDKQIYLYFAKDSREHHHLTDILKGYKCKYFQSDAYQAYEKLEGVTNVYCLAHARRKFYEDNPDEVDRILKEGTEAARSKAIEQMAKVRKAMKIDY